MRVFLPPFPVSGVEFQKCLIDKVTLFFTLLREKDE